MHVPFWGGFEDHPKKSLKFMGFHSPVFVMFIYTVDIGQTPIIRNIDVRIPMSFMESKNIKRLQQKFPSESHWHFNKSLEGMHRKIP